MSFLLNRSLIFFLCCVLAAGWLIGYLNIPGAWYAALVKPPFNPPGWVFGSVWTLLYVLIATAGWRTWQRHGFPHPAFRLWLAQMLLNFAWSPVFFSLHQLEAAFVIILLLLGLISAFVFNRWQTDRMAAWLFIPYAAWVTFAGVLNASLIALN